MSGKFKKSSEFGHFKADISITVQSGDRIIVGFSGGPDSVFLTQSLYGLQSEKDLTLFLAHVNYKLRGEESDEDEAFCRAMAKKLGLPIEVMVADLSGLESSAGNVQAVAREKRMEFFLSLAGKYDCNKIALGHTLDDNVETVLGNIFRGCGLDGLSGIGPVSAKVIRPLLKTAKADIIGFLDKNEIPYRIDSSNLASDYTRNKIRNLILPELRTRINPRVDEAVLRLSEIVSEASSYFIQAARRFCEDYVEFTHLGSAIIPLDSFSKLHLFLKKYLVKYLAERISGDIRGKIDFELISSAIEVLHGKTGSRVDLGAGMMMEKGADCLIIFFPADEIEPQEIEIPGKTVLKAFNLILHSELDEASKEIDRATDNWAVKIDVGEAGNNFTVRQYRNGDYFQPLGMSIAKKLSDFFIDRKIPRALRPEIPLLTRGDEIAWIMGHEISELYKIGSSPASPLKLWVEKVVKKVE